MPTLVPCILVALGIGPWLDARVAPPGRCATPGAAARTAERVDPADRLARALHRWHRAYVGSKLALRGMARDQGQTDKLYGRGLLPDRHPARLTHQQALELLMDLAPRLQTADVARRLLALASVGLDDRRYSFDAAPYRVRRMARGALARFTDAAALDAVLQTARGDREGWKSGEFEPQLQAAALRALGALNRSVFRPMVDAQLTHGDRIVRLAAAEAIRDLAHPRSLDAVRLQLNAEAEPSIAHTLVSAARRILDRHHAKIDAAATRRALRTAIDAIGRTDWRTDLAVVELCSAFRSTMAIEPLISILQRFVASSRDIEKGHISGILRQRTYEVLRSLTGALIPIDRPDLWREFWARERATFRLAAPRDDRAEEPDRTRTAFFGIPVTGSRVMFLIDTSGSMRIPYRVFQGDGTSTVDAETATRLMWAKRELARVVDALPPDAYFNVIPFAGDAKRWRSDLVTAEVRNRRALHKRIGSMVADGGTNIFAALQLALRIDGVRHGERYASAVDELFLLSDGEPSVGEVVDPGEILELITETNRFSRVRIHTIYMGGGESWFMRRLAEQNGGRYVRL